MDTFIELFGYLGSTMVVLSMLMSSVVKLRIINTLGSIISGIYALVIGSFPLALMNICLVIINLYNLRKLLMTKQEYELVPCSPQDAFVRYFLKHYASDIQTYFPGVFSTALDTVYLITCQGDPAGILLAQTNPQGGLDVAMEYTTPMYRDCSIGKFLYAALKEQGVPFLTIHAPSPLHRPYLEKMGYQCQGDDHILNLK